MINSNNYMNINATEGKTFQIQIPFSDFGVGILEIKKRYFVPVLVDYTNAYKLDEIITDMFSKYYDLLFHHRLLMNIIYLVNRSLGLTGEVDFSKGKTYFIPTDDESLFSEFKIKVITILQRNTAKQTIDKRFEG